MNNEEHSSKSNDNKMNNKTRAVFGLCGILLMVGVLTGAFAIYQTDKKLMDVPQKLLQTQKLQEALNNANNSLKSAKLSTDKEVILKNLEAFRESAETIRENLPSQRLQSLPQDDEKLRNRMNHYSDIKLRLQAYMYVIDNAHHEFQKLLESQTDKAYFELVRETDRSNSVSEVINNYVTPLVSTSQLGTDVNLIVANLEKAKSARETGTIDYLKDASEKAHKRINASFKVHIQDKNFDNLENITYQIVSFAHGNNNIFQLQRQLLSLEQELEGMFQQYEAAFEQIHAINAGQKNKHTENLYNHVSQTQNMIFVSLWLNLLILTGAAFYLGYPALRQALISFEANILRQLFSQIRALFTNLIPAKGQNRNFEPAAQDIDGIQKKDKEETRSWSQILSETKSEYPETDKDDDKIQLYKQRHSAKGSGTDFDDEQEKPLLLDTTMRISAQRNRLKKALSEMESPQNKEISTSDIRIEEIISRIKNYDLKDHGDTKTDINAENEDMSYKSRKAAG